MSKTVILVLLIRIDNKRQIKTTNAKDHNMINNTKWNDKHIPFFFFGQYVQRFNDVNIKDTILFGAKDVISSVVYQCMVRILSGCINVKRYMNINQIHKFFQWNKGTRATWATGPWCGNGKRERKMLQHFSFDNFNMANSRWL